MELKMLRLEQFERQKIQTCKRQFGKPSKPQWKSIKFDFFFFFKLSFFDCDRFMAIFLLFREGISIICISTGKIQSSCLSCMPIYTETHGYLPELATTKLGNNYQKSGCCQPLFTDQYIMFIQLDHRSSYHVSLVKLFFQF